MATSASERFFCGLVRHPWLVLLPMAAILLLSLVAFNGLTKDTRSDAFLSPDNPALVYRDVVRERFGLSDPLLVALVASGPEGIYRADVLQSVAALTEALKALPNVDADKVISLSTESLITGTESSIEVQPILDPMLGGSNFGDPIFDDRGPGSAVDGAAVRAMVEDFPLFVGSLVARGGEATLLVVQLLDEQQSEHTYAAIMALLDNYTLPPGVVVHVAGEGAIAGYLGAYIDADAKRLNPLAGVIILSMIALAFRRFLPALLALVIILASVFVALGSMAALNIPFYVITNGLPVILIGISVADTIHICSHYFHLQAAAPQRPRDELVVETMVAMWMPVTLTSVTTVAGFMGLYFAADMPPFRYFGLFAALGVTAAWLYSVVVLPPLMTLLKLQVHPRFIRKDGGRDWLGRLILGSGLLTRRRPLLLAAAGLIALGGAWAGSQLVVDDDRIRLFHPDEPIARADRAINEHFNGTNTLDIVVETAEPEGVFEPAVLYRMEALQAYAETLPHVAGSSSIVDYLKQMNRVLNDNDPAAYSLPESRDLVAQYFLLYSLSADPADFEQQVDYDYRTANVRLTMNNGGYVQIAQVVEDLQAYVAREFSGEVRATLSGRVALNYHWVHSIGNSHLAGLLAALLLVWALASLSYRSALAGVYTLIPVILAVLLVYGFMVARGMTLGVGTSMFAAVAIGLGVDFSIHTISRLQILYGATGGEEERMVARFLTTTGRALLFNVMTVAVGFGVLIFSQISQLSDFGSIVMLSMGVSFVASVTVLPALVLAVRPTFVTQALVSNRVARRKSLLRVTAQVAVVLALAAIWLVSSASASEERAASEELSAADVVARVNAVPQGEQVTRDLLFRTVDRQGRSRERKTVSYRRYFGDERRLVLFFTAPANIRDTAVLTWDYADSAKADDQWLYLPALRKVRRIPASDRGDYFLGTDFSFEDMKLDGRLSAEDYVYTLAAADNEDSVVLEGVPRSETLAEELGYSRTLTVVDVRNWMITKVDFWDRRGGHLKTLDVEDIRDVDGIPTRHRLVMQNHQTGHRTELEFEKVDYQTPIDERVFSQQALQRGQ